MSAQGRPKADMRNFGVSALRVAGRFLVSCHCLKSKHPVKTA